ncbi:MAG: hypothetical protein COT85_02150 [Chlamydiae bacterium CG10_big_fil_rev_8_21_14_0_10_42_34]|nr:MAG: hypothetical protein COT85_02150 [Chlamydiae bacterium CG10_big_fil_rev_8_21_14_0_10_42_34]
MSQELPFDPFSFIEGPHKQTILGAFCSFVSEPLSVQKFILLPDGDRLSLEITTPEGWKSTDPTVVMVHGLCGSHKSPYLVRFAKRLESMGIRAVRCNLRNCGSGFGHAKHMYHCGRSEDIFECIKVLKKETPESPFVLAGFSLGGNIVLKLAGELGSSGSAFLAGVISVSPPVELYSSVVMLGKEENSLYENYFYKLLREDVHYRHNKYKDLPRIRLPKGLKLYEFDQIYTAPISGFKSAFDYYDKCSAANVVEDIGVPCHILLSEDDPIISSSSLDKFSLPSYVTVFKTKKGGHLGYLGKSEDGKGYYWLDSKLTDWVKGFVGLS